MTYNFYEPLPGMDLVSFEALPRTSFTLRKAFVGLLFSHAAWIWSSSTQMIESWQKLADEYKCIVLKLSSRQYSSENGRF